MTTANLLNVSSVKGPQVDVSKKLQEEAREVSEIFASMMNQTADIPNPMAEDTASDMGVMKTDGTQSIADSYERYSYKDNQIEEAKEKEISPEEMDAIEDTLEQTEEEILNTISEEYGVDEETLRNLLDEMGLNVLDLLNPKNLVSFVMALTGMASGEELLLDESFLKIMETMDTLSNNLMKELNVDMNGLQDILSRMEVVNQENGAVTFEQELAAQVENLSEQTETAEGNVQQNAESSDEAVEGVKVQVEEDETVEKAEVKTNEAEAETVTSIDTGKESSLSGNENTGRDSLLNQDADANQVFVTNQSTQTVGQASEMPQMQFSSYMSTDAMQIMEQIAEQIRVVVKPETTSMEMQLNPENLGKIYLNVSSEEGAVTAQFFTTNEVVKEALEAQIATLRENLNQAGVKVDAIEVTIASHEFERNLEQNQQNRNEEMVQEEKAPRRRNITVDSLDELQGVMTEEETLVAQMMRDNGNSVDFTA